MARRTFQVIDVMEVLQHWHAGRPKTVVAASLGVDVKTIRKYVAAAEAEGIRPGDGLVSDRAGWAARVAGWFPELVDAQARSRTWPELEGRRELITKMIETNTLATVHQRLRDEHGLSASESSLRRFVGQAFPDRRGARLVTCCARARRSGRHRSTTATPGPRTRRSITTGASAPTTTATSTARSVPIRRPGP